MADWVDNLVSQLEENGGKFVASIDGQAVLVTVGKPIALFCVENQVMLRKVGQSTFKEMLDLMSEQKNEEAFMLLLKSMSPQDVIDHMNQNSAEQAADTDQRKAFWDKLEKLALSVGQSIILKAIVGLLAV